MTAPRFAERLNEQPIDVHRILLDPNNPRLLSTSFEGVREDRFGEPGVQAATLQKLNSGRFDMDRLRASIARSGLLEIDRIVVRPTLDDHFVVVEGNRRIGAVKTLLEQQEAGEIDLDATVLKTLAAPKVLVLEEENADAARLDQWVIQGIRHITGIRPWGGYQAARTIQAMVQELGYSEDEVVEALGLPKARIRRSLRVLSALEQMQEDDDFGDAAEPELYAYFDEVIKRPKLRAWFGWDPGTMTFQDEERLRSLYSWITPDDESEGKRKIPVAESIRSLDSVIDDEESVAMLGVPGATIDDALRVVRPGVEPEWREPVKRAVKALEGIPTSTLETLDGDDEQLIQSVKEIAERRLEVAAKIRK